MKKKRQAIYPGTFDPVTNGHLDILRRATELFDAVTVAVVEEPSKRTLFSLSERLDILRGSLKPIRFQCPVRVRSFSGLLVDFARREGIPTLVRGLRAISDFEYEFQISLMNRHQWPSLDTVFLMPDERYVYLSSSMVREIGRLGGRLGAFLPKPAIAALRSKWPR